MSAPNERPDWVACIRKPEPIAPTNRTPIMWCGERVMGFAFQSVEHAAGSGDSRFMVCPKCVDAVSGALAVMRWDDRRTAEEVLCGCGKRPHAAWCASKAVQGEPVAPRVGRP